jgi:hypothetical protein
MASAKEKIEKGYRFPCGPMDVKADTICRRSLRDSMDLLLDRLTLELNPSLPKKEIPSGLEVNEEGLLIGGKGETTEEKKQRLIEEGKIRAEVQFELKKYREELQGNSKMLQDISGKYESLK